MYQTNKLPRKNRKKWIKQNKTTWVKALDSTQCSQNLEAKILERREMHRGESDIPNCFSSLGIGLKKISHTRLRGREAEHSFWQSHRTGEIKWLDPRSWREGKNREVRQQLERLFLLGQFLTCKIHGEDGLQLWVQARNEDTDQSIQLQLRFWEGGSWNWEAGIGRRGIGKCFIFPVRNPEKLQLWNKSKPEIRQFSQRLNSNFKIAQPKA